MVVGAGDGAVYAFQPRTGKTIWKYQASTRGMNSQSARGRKRNRVLRTLRTERDRHDILGAVFAFDGNVEGEITEDKLLWKIPKRTVGRSCPVKLGDRVYFVEDGATLVIVDAKDRRSLSVRRNLVESCSAARSWRRKDLHRGEHRALLLLKPTEKGVDVVSEARLPQGEEVFGSPVISNGRIFIPSIEALYCIGKTGCGGHKIVEAELRS